MATAMGLLYDNKHSENAFSPSTNDFSDQGTSCTCTIHVRFLDSHRSTWILSLPHYSSEHCFMISSITFKFWRIPAYVTRPSSHLWRVWDLLS